MLYATPSQTVGPYLRIGLEWQDRGAASDTGVADGNAQPVTLTGQVFDGRGHLVSDGVLEFWHADAAGRYANQPDAGQAGASARGFARCCTDENGSFRLRAIVPGQVAGPGGAMQAPHIVVHVYMRGLLKQLHTRVYFPDQAANASDPVLQAVPQDRRGTLIAQPGSAAGELVWNVHVQGDDETVFFDL